MFISIYSYVKTTYAKLHNITNVKSTGKRTNNTLLLVHPLSKQLKSFITLLPLITPCIAAIQ